MNQIELKANKYMIPVNIVTEENYIYLQFQYNKDLLNEIKAMEGSHWCGYDEIPRKIWRINNSLRNQFQLAYLQGKNPYSLYDKEIIENSYLRPLYTHQCEMSNFMLTRKRCIVAGEMGVGKTLSIIEFMERVKKNNSCKDNLIWYVAPKSGIKAVEREFKIWNCQVKPDLLTYENLTKRIKLFEENNYTIPRIFILDECSRVKNPTAQRSQAALILANLMRETYGDDCYIILMSGTPAPRSPVDWWHLAEVACPGFLKEGNVFKFKKGLCILSEEEALYGGTYQHIVTWLDDTNKCALCGDYKENHNLTGQEAHPFTISVNEVARLSKRLEGLVLVKRKKDCLDLPDKIYREIKIDPSEQLLQVARTLLKSTPTTIAGLTLLRELSDGFQYHEEPVGMETCSVCLGKKVILDPIDNKEMIPCDGCGGKGEKKKYQRVTKEVGSPKDEALIDLLDENSDIGRIVIYAGFTGSIDRIVKICQSQKWNVIRVDGRGWWCDINSSDLSKLNVDHLSLFQDKIEQYPRVAFIAHPQSGGMGLTLTAASMIVYYSNDFNNESREQSEDRVHRIGVDSFRGATIVDLIHLESDQLVLDNLKKKKKLQLLTLGDIEEALKEN